MDNTVINQNPADALGNPEPKGMNVFKRISGIIFSPKRTMEDIIAKPGILFPVLLIIVASFLFLLVNFGMYKEFLKETSLDALSRMNIEITEEQLEAQIGITAVISLVSMPIMSIVMWLVGAALLFAGVKIFKGSGSFKQFASITGYAYVITVLSFILTSVVSYLTGNFNMQQNLTGLAVLLPAEMNGTFIYGVLNGVELFTIWQYIVIGIGIAGVSKLGRTKVYSIIGVIYALILVYSGFTQIMANMTMG